MVLPQTLLPGFSVPWRCGREGAGAPVSSPQAPGAVFSSPQRGGAAFFPLLSVLKRSADTPKSSHFAGLLTRRPEFEGNRGYLTIPIFCLLPAHKDFHRRAPSGLCQLVEEAVVHVPPFNSVLKLRTLLLEDTDDCLVCSRRRRPCRFLRN